MRPTVNWLTGFGCSLLVSAGMEAAPPRYVPISGPTGATANPSRLVPSSAPSKSSQVVPVSAPSSANASAATSEAQEERELKPLLDKLAELSTLIGNSSQSPNAWRFHLEQAEVLLQIAMRSKPHERDNMLRLAIDGYYSAAVISPKDQDIAQQNLRQLAGVIAKAFPGNPTIPYAALQEIQADCLRVLEKSGGDRGKEQTHRAARLLAFAKEYHNLPEAAKSVMEAAQINESQGKVEEARNCYRYLSESYPSDALGRKASGALWRLGRGSESVRLELPLLYSAEGASSLFKLSDLRGKMVVVYFWSAGCAKAAEDFQVLKQLTDRYMGRGLEVVYVNLDGNSDDARKFLSGRLTAGTHLHQKGGLDSPMAERYGIHALPQIFFVDRDGVLVKHSVTTAQVEAEVLSQLPRDR